MNYHLLTLRMAKISKMNNSVLRVGFKKKRNFISGYCYNSS